MIDTSPFIEKLDFLKEYLHKCIDNNMQKQLFITKRRENGKRHVYLDIRNFDAYYRHKTNTYISKMLRTIKMV